jgi:thiamine biosynthesis lipoprotein
VREIVSVSVLDTNGGRADAAATALSVAGRDSWARVATQMGISAALLIADDGAAYATPAMRDRLEPVGARLSDLHVVPLAPAQGTPDTDCVVD